MASKREGAGLKAAGGKKVLFTSIIAGISKLLVERSFLLSAWGDESLVHPPGLSNETHVIKNKKISGPGPGSKSRIDSES